MSILLDENNDLIYTSPEFTKGVNFLKGHIFSNHKDHVYYLKNGHIHFCIINPITDEYEELECHEFKEKLISMHVFEKTCYLLTGKYEIYYWNLETCEEPFKLDIKCESEFIPLDSHLIYVDQTVYHIPDMLEIRTAGDNGMIVYDELCVDVREYLSFKAYIRMYQLFVKFADKLVFAYQIFDTRNVSIQIIDQFHDKMLIKYNDATVYLSSLGFNALDSTKQYKFYRPSSNTKSARKK
jgi:hypothetical protein